MRGRDPPTLLPLAKDAGEMAIDAKINAAITLFIVRSPVDGRDSLDGETGSRHPSSVGVRLQLALAPR